MSRALLIAVVLVVGGCGSSPAPAPDITFVSSRDGAYQVYGMSSDGTHQRRLTHEQGDPATSDGLLYEIEPAWSPDGTSIAFASKRDGVLHLFAMNADGSGSRRLTDAKADDENPSWSPDGTKIAFDRAGDLFVMNADGTAAHRVVKDAVTELNPAWSPDGRWLAYVRKLDTSKREIWLVHPNGTGAHSVSNPRASSESPAWSPDGRRLAFSSDGGGTVMDIYVRGLSGKARRLTHKRSGAYEPAWSSDGKRLVFWSDGSIYAIDLSGRETRLTDGDGNDSSPEWRPGSPPSA